MSISQGNNKMWNENVEQKNIEGMQSRVKSYNNLHLYLFLIYTYFTTIRLSSILEINNILLYMKGEKICNINICHYLWNGYRTSLPFLHYSFYDLFFTNISIHHSSFVIAKSKILMQTLWQPQTRKPWLH